MGDKKKLQLVGVRFHVDDVYWIRPYNATSAIRLQWHRHNKANAAVDLRFCCRRRKTLREETCLLFYFCAHEMIVDVEACDAISTWIRLHSQLNTRSWMFAPVMTCFWQMIFRLHQIDMPTNRAAFTLISLHLISFNFRADVFKFQHWAKAEHKCERSRECPFTCSQDVITRYESRFQERAPGHFPSRQQMLSSSWM